MFDFIFTTIDWVHFLIFIGMLLSILTYLGPVLLHAYVLKPQNLKRKYNAKWALVTGGSSGIGRAISEKLASQGLNVVIVALDDHLLKDIISSLKERHPDQEFIAVGADMSSPTFMDDVVNATQDIDVSLVFNNAGYITLGLFPDTGLQRQLQNYDVNATAAVRVSHHFANEMIEKKLKGAIMFTSSPVAFMPTPFSVIYGASKAFLTTFATSLAGELKGDGIDVCVVHPSPTDTRFYTDEATKQSGSLAMFRKTATPPTTIADALFTSIGQPFGVVRDQGYFSISVKMLMKVIDYNFIAWIMSVTSSLSGEYRGFMDARKNSKKRE